MGMVTYEIGGRPESQGSKFEHAKGCSGGGSGVARARKSLVVEIRMHGFEVEMRCYSGILSTIIVI